MKRPSLRRKRGAEHRKKGGFHKSDMQKQSFLKNKLDRRRLRHKIAEKGAL